MKITHKKGRGDKIHLSVDGEYIFTVDETFYHLLCIDENYEYSAEELNEFIVKTGERCAYNCAVSLLSRRDHTVKEIKDKLMQKGYAQYADTTVEKLKNQGYLSDERFAEMYLKELINLKNYGKKRIVQELLRKGINRDIIDEVLSVTEMPDCRLIELIKRKYIRHLDNDKGVQKTINALLRLGYSYSEIRDALREIADSEELCEVNYE